MRALADQVKSIGNEEPGLQTLYYYGVSRYGVRAENPGNGKWGGASDVVSARRVQLRRQ